MKYRPNLWSTVDRIQTSPDDRRSRDPLGDDRKRLVYLPDVHYKHNTKVFSDAQRLERELKNAFRL